MADNRITDSFDIMIVPGKVMNPDSAAVPIAEPQNDGYCLLWCIAAFFITVIIVLLHIGLVTMNRGQNVEIDPVPDKVEPVKAIPQKAEVATEPIQGREALKKWMDDTFAPIYKLCREKSPDFIQDTLGLPFRNSGDSIQNYLTGKVMQCFGNASISDNANDLLPLEKVAFYLMSFDNQKHVRDLVKTGLSSKNIFSTTKFPSQAMRSVDTFSNVLRNGMIKRGTEVIPELYYWEPTRAIADVYLKTDALTAQVGQRFIHNEFIYGPSSADRGFSNLRIKILDAPVVDLAPEKGDRWHYAMLPGATLEVAGITRSGGIKEVICKVVSPGQ